MVCPTLRKVLYTHLMQNENRTYFAFIWHAVFLSITVTFTEINTIIPAMILEIGGREIHVGIVTAIMIGIPLVTQLLFAGLLQGQPRKKPFLIAGISLRVTALAAIAFTLRFIQSFSVTTGLLTIYAELMLFTVGGSFATISYVDLLGKGISQERLQKFFPQKQIISGIGVLVSALIARVILGNLSYPASYVVLFGAAAVMLLVASIGFWMIHEPTNPIEKPAGAFSILASVPALLRHDINLRRYILFNNFMGFSVALMPFYMALAKHAYFLDPSLAGTILFIQILGNIIASLVWPLIVLRWGYKPILRIWAVGAVFLPIAALVISSFAPLPVYVALFAFSGILISARTVTHDAMIVNLSTKENRVLYTGAIGTLNLSVALFPLVLGGLLRHVEYSVVFLGVAAMALVANHFLSRLKCPLNKRSKVLEKRIA